jgi:hypothetical protein
MDRCCLHFNCDVSELSWRQSDESPGVVIRRARRLDAAAYVAHHVITTNPKIMGRWVNTRPLNVLGWLTTAAIFTASLGFLVIWLREQQEKPEV